MTPIAVAVAAKIVTISAEKIEVSEIVETPDGGGMILPGGCWSPDGSLLAHCVEPGPPGSPLSVVSLVSDPRFP